MCNYKDTKSSNVDWINYKNPLVEEDDECFDDGNEMPEWWDADSVFKNLEIDDQDKALYELDPDEKQSINATRGWSDAGQPESITLHSINSSALLYLMMISQTPLGRKLRRWVTHKVLPAILFGNVKLVDISKGEEDLINETRFILGIYKRDTNVINFPLLN